MRDGLFHAVFENAEMLLLETGDRAIEGSQTVTGTSTRLSPRGYWLSAGTPREAPNFGRGSVFTCPWKAAAISERHDARRECAVYLTYAFPRVL